MKTDAVGIGVAHFDGGIILTFKDAKITKYRQVETLKTQILPLLEKARKQKVVLDFANLQFLATPIFALLIKIREKAGKLGGRVELCNISPTIKEVLDVTNLTKIFPISNDPRANL